MDRPIINRVWAMPNKWTFQIPPIADLLARYVGDGKGWIDPFAGMTSPAEITNDINPDTKAQCHMDAIDFLSTLKGQYKGILFDPPYSPRQISECYKQIGREVTMEDTQNSRLYHSIKLEINRLIDKNGLVISFGWNSSGMNRGKYFSGFQMEEILLVCHGAAHNDTIVTVERKVQSNFLLECQQMKLAEGAK